MNGVRVLIVDDEPLARRRLVRMLKPYGWIAEAREAANIDQAARQIAEFRPDILLLDIQMPGGTGFDLLDRLRDSAPAIIFVTAYNDYAIEAFRKNAIDYLVKPVEDRAFHDAILKARASRESQALSGRIQELEETLAALRGRVLNGEAVTQPPREDGIWIKTRAGHNRIAIADIFKVCAERDYVRIYARQGDYLHAEGMGRIEERLPSPDFLRVHRSTIVRVDAVTQIRSSRTGSMHLTLFDGGDVRVGRKYAHDARSIIQRGNVN